MSTVTFNLRMEKGVATTTPEIRQQLSPLESEIVETLHPLGVDLDGKSDKEWTTAIKARLGQLAEDKGLLQYPNSLKGRWQRGGEWMLDVVWAKATRDEKGRFDWRTTQGLALACESEWASGEYDILADFMKLTFVVADLRLFIYTNSLVKGVHPVKMCTDVCPDSRDFRYLLIGFPGEEATCRVDAWTH